MIWAYLIIFDDKLGTREDVQRFLDSMEEVRFWHSSLPNCVFFSCSLTADTIAKKVVHHFGDPDIRRYRFMVAEVHSDRQGWLPKNVWRFFRNPTLTNGEDDPKEGT